MEGTGVVMRDDGGYDDGIKAVVLRSKQQQHPLLRSEQRLTAFQCDPFTARRFEPFNFVEGGDGIGSACAEHTHWKLPSRRLVRRISYPSGIAAIPSSYSVMISRYPVQRLQVQIYRGSLYGSQLNGTFFIHATNVASNTPNVRRESFPRCPMISLEHRARLHSFATQASRQNFSTCPPAVQALAGLDMFAQVDNAPGGFSKPNIQLTENVKRVPTPMAGPNSR